MTSDRDPVPLVIAAGLLVALIAWVTFHRWQFLAASPYPWGIDGYFYPIQVRSLLETGGLHYDSAPLSLWLMAPLAALGGIVWSVKVVAAVGIAVVAWPIYGVSRELGSERAPALLSATIATTAAAAFYMSTEFIKNGVGVTAAAFAIWAVLVAARRRDRQAIALALVAFAAAWLTHKSATGLVALTTGGLLVRAMLRRKHGSAIVAAAVGALLLASALFPHRFLGVADLALIGDLFAGDFDIRLPVLGGQQSFYFGHEVPLALVAALLYWGVARRGATEDKRVVATWVLAPLTAFVALSAIPVLDVADPNSLGFRLRLLGFVSLAIVVGPMFMGCLRSLKPLYRASVALAVGGFVITFRPTSYEAPVVEQHPALVAAVAAAHGAIPEGDGIVTPERRLVFMVTWFANRPAAQNPASIPAARRWRLLPLPYMTTALQLAIDAERRTQSNGTTVRSLHPYDPMGLVLLRESAWQSALARLSPADRATYEAWPTY